MASINKLLSKAVHLHQIGKLDAAKVIYQQILRIESTHGDALNLLGLIALHEKQTDEALLYIAQAIAQSPNNAIYQNNFGEAQRLSGNLAGAASSFQIAIDLDPSYATAWGNLGFALHLLSLNTDAQACLERALELHPFYPDAWNNLGLVAKAQGQLGEALECFQQAITQHPNFVLAINNLANALAEQRAFSEAIGLYRKVLAIEPNNAMAKMNLLHHQLNIAEWSEDMEELGTQVKKAVRTNKCEGVSPFSFMTIFSTAEEQRQCAENWFKSRLQQTNKALIAPTVASRISATDTIIRIGYLSPDFRIHPVSLLIAGLLEQHDRTRFRVYGYSIGANDHSHVRSRIEKACDVFRDLSESTISDAADSIRKDRIDILVDLAGYTHGSKPELLILRPGKIQVGYIGYLGTTGGDALDYVISDECLTPEGSETFYSERLVKLPWYQVNTREPLTEPPSRASNGLPETAFVICCFNQTMKIQPIVFSIWMKLLRESPDAVLWLLADIEESKENLTTQAEKAGVKAHRIIFAERVMPTEYYSRLQLADLFLDTLPYNAGTTAADALWAGVPVLTCYGETFSGRMASSVLTAFGMPELITHSLSEYYSLAFELMHDTEKLEATKEKISRLRNSANLFNTQSFTKHFEDALTLMFERHTSGLPPEHLLIKNIT